MAKVTSEKLSEMSIETVAYYPLLDRGLCRIGRIYKEVCLSFHLLIYLSVHPSQTLLNQEMLLLKVVTYSVMKKCLRGYHLIPGDHQGTLRAPPGSVVY